MSANPIAAGLLTVAKKIDNYEIDPATGLKVLWTTTQIYKVVVPANKRWYLIGGFGFRGVSATMTASVYNISDKIILYLADWAAGTGMAHYPETANTGNAIFPWPMDPGEYLQLTFGVAQNANSYATCNVLEIDI